ncbi:MAG TPA: hypothetical protein VMH24_07295 [Candidatus Sulfotelmatobacter sp.]|nr:hypothetical protein [Candidatus Sulfotelmatobacter sp.]
MTGRRTMTPRELVLWAGGIAGFVFGAFAFVTIEASVGGQWFRTGPDLDAYLRAGHDLLNGNPVYVGQIGEATNFPYAPPWAVIAAGLALLPPLLVQAAIIGLDLAAMRYVAGSWRGVGWILLWPLTAFELSAGNIDLLIAAAIVLAWAGSRARVEPLVLVALAKLAPVLALPPARWRGAIVALAVGLLVTLPVLHLWPDWFAYLARQPSSIPISLPVGPWYLRLPVALVLAGLGTFVLRRPWLSALAVVVAMPSLYLSTTVILIAPIRLWLDERRPATPEPAGRGAAGPGAPGATRPAAATRQ